MKRITFALLIFLLAACNFPAATPAIRSATPPSATASPTGTATRPPTETLTPQPSETPSATPTPTASETPSITPSPTYTFPAVTVNQQAHCRYGPSKAYLHAADLYAGDSGTVRGRFQYSAWLLVKFDKLNYFCWVAPSVVTVSGALENILFSEVRLPGPSVLYNPPQSVLATRNDNKVTITWSQVDMTEDDDRGYMLELWVCQDGAYLWWTAALENDTQTSYTVRDEPGCAAPSSGVVYAVEKHGYVRPAVIPWPAP
ncbi:MAG: hypothetical protein OHK0031_11100 [Anaerolineales bacterium]